jgi:hypothetical protein
MTMQIRFLLVVVPVFFGICSCGASYGEEILLLSRKSKVGDFKAGSIRLSEADAIEVGKVNANLDLDGHIDVIETPFGDVLKHAGFGRNLSIAVDLDGLKKSGVTLEQLTTLRSEGVPLRKCLHELLDPLHLTFVVCPEGLLVVAKEDKEKKK